MALVGMLHVASTLSLNDSQHDRDQIIVSLVDKFCVSEL
jgi:hypothetical protein